MQPENAAIVITGASSGIGRAAALALATRRARLLLVSRQQRVMEELAAQCLLAGSPAAIGIAADVADEEAMAGVASRAAAEFGSLDVWINNAAVALYGVLDEVPSEDFRRVIDTNLFGYINGARAALPRFRSQRAGILINVVSVVGKGGQAWADAYVISKFGIYGLASALRQDLIDYPAIRIVSVIPPSVDTPLFQHGGNFTGRRARAIAPAYRAETVAAAIVRAIEKPRREVPVGMQAWLGVMTARFFPALFEQGFARIARVSHFENVPQPPTHGNIFEPDPDWNTVSGGWRRSEALGVVAFLPRRAWRLARRLLGRL